MDELRLLVAHPKKGQGRYLQERLGRSAEAILSRRYRLRKEPELLKRLKEQVGGL